MKKQEYPKWRYHKTLQPKLVNNEAEDKALGQAWGSFFEINPDAPGAPKKVLTEKVEVLKTIEQEIESFSSELSEMPQPKLKKPKRMKQENGHSA